MPQKLRIPTPSLPLTKNHPAPSRNLHQLAPRPPIASPADPLERAADSEAARVMSHPAPFPSPLTASPANGAPLAPAARRFYESRFQHDFSAVRLFSDDRAARSLHAKAFTSGQEIVFGSAARSSSPAVEKRVLAHELAHVVQNDRGQARDSLHRNAEDVPELDHKFAQARHSGDWQTAAEVLNAFSREDILKRLEPLRADQIAALHAGAIQNPRVGPGSQVALLTSQSVTPTPPCQFANCHAPAQSSTSLAGAMPPLSPETRLSWGIPPTAFSTPQKSAAPPSPNAHAGTRSLPAPAAKSPFKSAGAKEAEKWLAVGDAIAANPNPYSYLPTRTPFETKMRNEGAKLRYEPVWSLQNDLPIGYKYSSGGYTQYFTLDGEIAGSSEIPIESTMSPIDFIPFEMAGSAVLTGGRSIGRKLVMSAARYAAKEVAVEGAEVTAKLATEAVTKEAVTMAGAGKVASSFLEGGADIAYGETFTSIGNDVATVRVAAARKPWPGVHDVIVHAEAEARRLSPGIALKGGGMRVMETHEAQIAEAILGNPNLGPRQPIRMISCALNPEQAQAIANITRRPVFASPLVVGVGEGPGTIPVSQFTRWDPVLKDWSRVVDASTKETLQVWNIYYPLQP